MDMYLTNVRKYVLSGATVLFDKSFLRKTSLGPFLMTVLTGIAPGVILKSYWLCIMFSLIFLSVLCITAVFLLSFKELTLIRKLVSSTIIYFSYVSVLCLIELAYFAIWKGFDPEIIILFLPIVFVPIAAAAKTYTILKKKPYDPKGIKKSNKKTVGFLSMVFVIRIAAVCFRGIDQSVAFAVSLIGLTLVNSFLSLGLLNGQKLYYCLRYKIVEEREEGAR